MEAHRRRRLGTLALPRPFARARLAPRSRVRARIPARGRGALRERHERDIPGDRPEVPRLAFDADDRGGHLRALAGQLRHCPGGSRWQHSGGSHDPQSGAGVRAHAPDARGVLRGSLRWRKRFKGTSTGGSSALSSFKQFLQTTFAVL